MLLAAGVELGLERNDCSGKLMYRTSMTVI